MKSFWIFCFVSLFAFPAMAHSPYAIYGHKITDNEDNSYLIERLYGDGIFFADPVRTQIRNQNGAVVAHTPTGKGVAWLCPFASFCYAFVDSGIGFPATYKLLQDNLDPTLLYAGKDNDEVQSYFKKETSRVKSERDGYPEENNAAWNFREVSIIWAIPGFFLLLFSNYIVAPLLFLSALGYEVVARIKGVKGFYLFAKICGLTILGLFTCLLGLGIMLYGTMGMLQIGFMAGLAHCSSLLLNKGKANTTI